MEISKYTNGSLNRIVFTGREHRYVEIRRDGGDLFWFDVKEPSPKIPLDADDRWMWEFCEAIREEITGDTRLLFPNIEIAEIYQALKHLR